MGTTGDWNDFSTELEQMTESNLVTAQLAYAYPKLAELAELRGDRAFAAHVRDYVDGEIANSERITPELYRARTGLWTRIKQAAAFFVMPR